MKLILKLFDQLPQPLKKKVDEIYFNQLSNGNSEIQELCVIYVSKSKEITVHKYKFTHLFIYLSLFVFFDKNYDI